jgi:hypothetical protein
MAVSVAMVTRLRLQAKALPRNRGRFACAVQQVPALPARESGITKIFTSSLCSFPVRHLGSALTEQHSCSAQPQEWFCAFVLFLSMLCTYGVIQKWHRK